MDGTFAALDLRQDKMCGILKLIVINRGFI